MAIRFNSFQPKKAGIKLASSLVALSSVMAFQYAVAQEEVADAGETEEVFVTGVRKNLMNASDLKRNSDTFVDAITAEDIGSLPDRSVLEAIQRLPGVTVERFAGPSDPDHFSTEGSGALVRGLTATRSEFNGRDSFSATNGRGLSFNDISPELMGGVDVFKNQTADMIEGGIGGTINLRTRKPFDTDGQSLAFTVDYSKGDLAEEWTPSFSALYSNRWDTDAGEFGFLASFANSSLRSASHGIQADAFVTYNASDLAGAEDFVSVNDGQVFMANGSNFTIKDDEREREGLSLALQWESPDDTLLTTLEYVHSKAALTWTERAMKYSGGFFDADQLTETRNTRALAGTEFEFDENGVFQQGTLVNGEGWRTSDNNVDRIPRASWAGPGHVDQFGQKTTAETRYKDEQNTIDDLSFSLKWTPSDFVEIDWSVQYIKADRRDDDVVVHLETQAAQTLDYSGGTASATIVSPWISADEDTRNAGLSVRDADPATYAAGWGGFSGDEAGDTNWFTDPASYILRSAMDHYERSEGDASGSNFDLTLHHDGDFVKSVKMGLRYNKREQTNRLTDWNWGELGDVSAVRGLWLDEIPDFTAANVEAYDVTDFYRGDEDVLSLQGGSALFATQDFVRSLILASDSELADIPRNDNANWVPYQARDGVDSEFGLFSPGEQYTTTETNKAAYMRIDFGMDDLAIPISGNVGVRYVSLERQALGSVIFPDLRSNAVRNDRPDQAIPDGVALPLNQNSLFNYAVSQAGGDSHYEIYRYLEDNRTANAWMGDATLWLPDEDRAFGDNSESLNTVNSSDDMILPSLNLKFELSDELIARFAISKAVSLPSMDQVRNSRSLGLTPNIGVAEIEDGAGGFVLTDPDTGEPVLTDEGLAVVVPNDARDIFAPGVTVGVGYTANGGTPTLKPMESTQWDLSLEWYFGNGNQLTGTIFHKDLDQFFVFGTQDIPYTNPNNGIRNSVEVTNVTNGDKGEMDGFELSYQQFFDFLPAGLDGLGVQASYTYIDAAGVPNNEIPADQDDFVNDWTDTGARVNLDTIPLQGQSDETFNFTVMYEKYNWSARIAYNWRSEYLLTTRDVISKYPLWNESDARVDGSVFYTFMDKYKVGIQASNLTDTESRTTAVINDDGLRVGRSWFKEDRRVSLVFQGKF
ncbi:MAG: iron complex outermembrane receptor protein [Flavobacteriales bacterium]|jgi:iron complex outermembrane receptor protein